MAAHVHPMRIRAVAATTVCTRAARHDQGGANNALHNAAQTMSSESQDCVISHLRARCGRRPPAHAGPYPPAAHAAYQTPPLLMLLSTLFPLLRNLQVFSTPATPSSSTCAGGSARTWLHAYSRQEQDHPSGPPRTAAARAHRFPPPLLPNALPTMRQTHAFFSCAAPTAPVTQSAEALYHRTCLLP